MGRKASRASTRLVTEHLRECPECRAYYQAARKGWHPRPRIHLASAPRDTQMRYFQWSLAALAILASLICMVVNYAVEKRLSWGWIVAGAMVCSTFPAMVYLWSYTNRFLKAMLSFSLLAMLLLGLIQYVLYNTMGIGGVWIWRVATPVAAIWLAAVWLGMLVVKWRSMNGFFCLSMILFLCIPADIATEGIAVAYTMETFEMHWVNLSCYAVAAAVCWMMGVLFDARFKRN